MSIPRLVPACKIKYDSYGDKLPLTGSCKGAWVVPIHGERRGHLIQFIVEEEIQRTQDVGLSGAI
jgi:hypothetical protein